MKVFQSILASLGLSLLLACTHSAADKQKSEVEHMLETRIEKLESQIEKLERRSADLTGTAKLAASKALEALEAQLESAKDEFEELEDASSANWANIKQSMEEKMSTLDLAYDKVAEYFAQ